MEHREHFVIIWDFVKENELMRHTVTGVRRKTNHRAK